MEAQEEGIRLETLASPLEILGERGAVVGIRLQRMQPETSERTAAAGSTPSKTANSSCPATAWLRPSTRRWTTISSTPWRSASKPIWT